ncbi:bifunctional 4-hydroxy-2-oxoglutarate aldolase/2-dehydro-3-deoxy-phosphogluconate aldolase [Pseudomonas sp. NCCP-436]|uniref:bifunctional 4-hydroxy-2-oxoglutarate aldolase/2-dehydro-3-deoxy-phosphogluconate aldolase n=1 Tax=Pseudomonas sp. NCCP-436 TaxID=2842481 RepID=UPI001C827910|nr:bifunctional 4-hydroxy-2-oxoglutarate aldolase/2-dehydro-3-deoxy-phosphogluconate aldolase [Pseudomonas sp. NCCP-436]GIZ13466.1 ketohydroxyglutarate aldolase [Pseudomonas sp. NCCP-436]
MTSPDLSLPARMAEKIAEIDRICAQARIMPVITIAREEDILPLADALTAGGLTVLEVTLRSKFGLEAIRRLRAERPELCIGAGTVLDEGMLAAATEAGAQFIVTPGSTRELLLAALDNPLPLLPGISSASELMVGYALGYRRFKLFPAEICGGVAALKAFSGPFGGVRFCPTGGISTDNLQHYMAEPNVMCVGGTWMFRREWVEQGDWTRIAQCSSEALQLLA